GGCSFIPSGTGPQPASGAAPPPGAGSCCGLVVRPPQPGWSPEDVVTNFLLASAIAADDFHDARQYLTDDANRVWHPGAEVTILAGEPQVYGVPPQVSGPGTKPTVLVTGQEQARLSSTGQYIPVPGGKPREEFVLEKTNGLYKIAQLTTPGSKVSHQLL